MGPWPGPSALPGSQANLCPHSVDLSVCFSYSAAPSSYSPIVGECGLPLRPTVLDFRAGGGYSVVERRASVNRIRLEQLSSSLAPPFCPHATALDYVLDGDTDRRLRGQVPRVTFLSRAPDDPKHQASGTVWLKHQHDRVCGDTVFQLQVDIDPLASEGHYH